MERYSEILSDTQVLFEVAPGNIRLFDTSMDYDGNTFSTSSEILDFLNAKYA